MSKIEWTERSWNPVTGCSKVSPGCKHCYMFAMYPRLRAMGVAGYSASPDAVTLLPERLLEPSRWRKPTRVFVNSMSDLFHPDVPFEYIEEVYVAMAKAPRHIYQVLTKRPERAVEWARTSDLVRDRGVIDWWMGVSIESQDYAHRIETLAQGFPAGVLWVSAEPLLGPLDLSEYLDAAYIDWLVCGGESGPRARPMELDWARSLRDQCSEAGVPFFLKQLGGRRGKRGGDEALLDSVRYIEYPWGG